MSKKANIVIRYSSLGDLVLCSALISKLNAEEANNPCIVVSKDEYKKLIIERFPHENIQFHTGSKGSFKPFFEGMKLVSSCVKKLNVSEIVVYDLHCNLKSTMFSLGIKLKSMLLKIESSINRTKRHSFSRMLSIMFHRDLNGKRHVFLDHLRTTNSSMNYFPQLKAFDRTPRTTERILIAPDAKHWKKRWIVSHWEKLFHLLLMHPRNFELTLVGGKDCLPMDVVDNLEIAGKSRVENLLGKTLIHDLPDLAANHDVTICSNSAWLHISESVGVPVVSLSGPIVPGFGFSPWLPKSRELYVNLDCRPCSKHGGGKCLKSGSDFHACMKRIEAEEVYNEVLANLRLNK